MTTSNEVSGSAMMEVKEKLLAYAGKLSQDPEDGETLAKLQALRREVAPDAVRGDLDLLRELTTTRAWLIEQGYPEVALEILAAELLVADEEAMRADLLYERARILDEEVLDVEAALGVLEEVLEVAPDHKGATERLATIQATREKWEQIAQHYVQNAESADSRELATSLYASAAELYWKYDRENPKVEEYLRKSLEVDPANRQAHRRLVRLLSGRGDWAAVVEAHEAFAESVSDPAEKVRALVFAARAAERHLGDVERAGRLYARALELDPTSEFALSAVVDFYTRTENWQALIGVYEDRVRQQARHADLGLYLQIAMLWWKKLGDLEQAEPYFRRVVRAEPTHPLALSFYREFYAQTGDYKELISLLRQAQHKTSDPGEKLALAVEMARLAEEKLGEKERAIDLWKAVLRLDPQHEEAKEALKRLYRETQKWNALLEILKEGVAALGEDQVQEKVARLLEIVDIYEKLGVEVMILNTYNQILDIQPDNVEVLEALARKYEEADRVNDLIGVLKRRAGVTQDPGERKALLRRVAALWMDRVGNHAKAVEPLEEILSIDPGDQEAIEGLIRIYEKRRNWKGLLELYRRQLQVLPKEERPARLREMAALAQQRLGDVGRAIALWNEVLEYDEEDPEAVEALLQLYQREKRWPAVAEMLERKLARTTSRAEQLSLLETLGSLWSDRLGGTKKAIVVWSRVLEHQPDHPKALRVLRTLYAEEGDWQALEELFGKRDRWTEYVDTLLQAADRTEDPEQRVALYFKVAQVWIERLGKPDRAVKAYERILAVDPDNLEAARALVPIYEQGQKWPRLVNTYQILLDHAESDEERLDYYRKLWEVCEKHLGAKMDAFNWCARAYVLRPDDEEIRGELERLAAQAHAWQRLMEVYAGRVEAVEDEAERTRLYRRMAEIAHQELGKLEEAETYYRRVLEALPEDTEALDALESIYTQIEDWPHLLEVSKRRAEAARDEEVQLEYLARAGLLQEEHLEDLDGAAATYEEILALRPSDTKALRALERVHEARGDWRALADVLSRQLEYAKDPLDRCNLLHRLGKLLEEKLSDEEEAIERFRQVLELDPLHKGAVSELEKYLAEGSPHRVTVAEILAPYYERTESWRELASCIEVLADAEGDQEKKLELLRRLVDVQARKLGDTAAGMLVALSIFDLEPADAENRKVLRELADLENDWDSVAQAYAAKLDTVEDELRRDLAWELAQIYDEELGEQEKARRYYEQVLEVDEEHEGAFEALRRILGQIEDYAALRALMYRRARITVDLEAKKDLLFQVANLDEDVLGDNEAAIGVYQEILSLEPSNEAAYAALERLYGSQGRWEDLEELLARELEYAEDEEKAADLRFRRGRILADHLGDGEGAVELFQEVLASSPAHEGALEALEGLLENEKLRQRVAAILEPIYERTGALGKLVDVLEVRLEAAEGDQNATVELLHRMAELRAKAGDLDASFQTWRRAVQTMPSDAHAREAIEELVAELGRWQDLAVVWKEALEACPEEDLGLKAEYILRLAKLYEERVLDPDRAAEWYEALLELDPSNLDNCRLAASALVRLYETAGEWQKLVDILNREVDWSEDVDERKEHLFRIAEIQEQYLGDEEAAVETFKALVEQDPEDRQALDSLERLYVKGDKWAELVEVLKRRAEITRDPDERRDLWARIAMLYEEALEDLNEAVAAWNTLLDERPEDLEAIRALVRLYEQLERWRDLYDMLERELALTEDLPSRVSLIYRIGSILHRHLEDAERAISRYREVLELDPEHRAARQALEDLLEDDVLAIQAAEILEPLYQAESNWERLCSIYELKARNTADPAEKVALYRRIAEIQETGLEDSRGAFESYGKALAEAVGLPELKDVMASVERLTAQDGRWAELVELYKKVSEDVLDLAIQEQMRLTVADVARNRLGDFQTAREFYEKVLEASPENERAMDALETLYQELEEYEALLRIYLQRAEILAGDLDRHREYLARAAVLCEEVLERPEQAMELWERVLSVVPDDLQATEALDRLYAKAEKWAELAELLERRLAYVEKIQDAVAIRYRLGVLWQEKLDDPDRALLNFRAALGGDPNHADSVARIEAFLEDEERRGEAAEVLEPIYAYRQDWPRLIEVYEIRREAVQDPAERPALTRRIAVLYEEQMEDLDKAFDWYGKLFAESPEEPGIRDQLARLANVLDKWQELAEVYASYLEGVFEENETSLSVARELAEILDEKLGDVQRAKQYYLRVLAADRTQEEVFKALERMLSRAERWQDLLEVYQDAADNTFDPAERKALLFKMSVLYEEPLEDPERAVDVYRSILDIDERDERAAAALERLLTQLGRWTDLVEFYHRQLDFAQGDQEVIVLKLKLGKVYTEYLEDASAAVDAYEEVLRLDVRNEEALAALERLILDEEHRFRIAQILEPIYKELDEWKKLVVIYEAQLDFIDDRTRRVEILTEVSRLHEERGGDYSLAFDALAKAWLEDVSDQEILEQLEALATKLGDWRRYVEVLEQGVEQSYDPELLAIMYGKMARVYERALGDKEKAVEAYQKLLEAQEDSEDAVAALERLLSELGRYEDLVPILKKKAEMAPSPLESVEVLYKLAEVQETVLGRMEDAIETWRQVLAASEEDELALNALERLYEATGAWTELVEIYRRKVDLAVDPATKRELLLKRAGVFRDPEKVGDVYEAIATYLAVLELFPEDVETLNALREVYTQEKMWGDLLEVLDKLAQAAEVAEERERLVYEAGRVLEEEMGDLEGAIERYRRVVEWNPNHAETRQALERLVHSESAREPAAAVLEPLLRTAGELDKLVEVYELLLADEADPVRRVELLGKIADVAEHGLGDSRAAFGAYARALREDPSQEAVRDELFRLAQALGSWKELADLYVEVLANVYDPALARQLHVTVARIQEEALGDLDAAIEHYREALAGGDDLEVLQALDRLLAQTGRWEELAEVLTREVEVAPEDALQIELLHRLGLLRLERFEDRQGALDAFSQVLDRQPGHEATLQALERLLEDPDYALKALDVLEPAYANLGYYDKVVALTRRRIALLEDPYDRAQLQERVAELCERELSNPQEALVAMIEALLLVPGEVRYVEEIERLADLTGDWRTAAEGLRQAIEKADDESVIRDLALRAARWYIDRLTDVDTAQALYNKVLEVDESNLDAVTALEAIFRARGDTRRLVDVLRKKASLVFDAAEKRRVLLEVAALAEDVLDDKAVAAEAWKAVLELDMADREALDALERLYEAQEDWEALVEVLHRKADLAEDATELLRLRHKLGAVYLERLGDTERAVEAYKDALDVEPQDEDALDALEAIYTRTEEWHEVQDVLLRRMTALPDGPQRVPVYARLARLAEERFDNPEEAISYWLQIQQVDPANDEAFRELFRLFEAQERWYDLAELYQRYAELKGEAGDTAGELEYLVKAAQVWEGKLENQDTAAEVLEKVLERDPNHVGALNALARMYESTEQWEKCREVLERAASVGATGRDAAELAFRQGRVAEKLGNPDEAYEFYLKAMALDDTHEEALDAVEAMAREREDWKKVAEVVHARARKAATPDEEVPYLVALGELYVDKIGYPEGGIPFLERALELKPDAPEVLEPLANIYYAAGRNDEAERLYEGLVAELAKQHRRSKKLAVYYSRLGGLAERRGDREKALEYYDKAYRIDTTNAETLVALGRLYMEQEDWEKARRIYRAMLLQNLDESAGLTKADIYYNLGLIHIQMEEPKKAKNMLKRGLEVDPNHQGIQSLLSQLE